MLSVTDVAVTVTLFDVGTVAGAVYATAAPLALVAGLKLPHCELPQVTDQFTPPLLLSLVTTAVKLPFDPATIDDGACGLNVTVIGGGVIVIVADTVFVLSESDVAVTVTVLDAGTVAGAVYVTAAPLAVVAGLKLPHCGLPQATDQLTPPFLLSLVTTAVKLALVLASSDEAGCGLKEIPITGGGVGAIVIVVDTVLVVSETDAAVIVTVLEAGTAAGAV